jgi:hypothetical protein
VFPEIAPGLIIQFPVGNPLNKTLPVAVKQVGCVIVPNVGAVGKEFIVTVTAFLTVVYEFEPAL